MKVEELLHQPNLDRYIKTVIVENPHKLKKINKAKLRVSKAITKQQRNKSKYESITNNFIFQITSQLSNSFAKESIFIFQEGVN